MPSLNETIREVFRFGAPRCEVHKEDHIELKILNEQSLIVEQDQRRLILLKRQPRVPKSSTGYRAVATKAVSRRAGRGHPGKLNPGEPVQQTSAADYSKNAKFA
jgi:hypothetical protein